MKTALVIIDMQKGFINDNTRHLISPIVDFIQSHNFDLIIGTRYINTPKTACYKFEGWKDCMEGTADVEIVPELLPFCNMQIDKSVYSCWPTIKSSIQDNKIERVVMVGVNTGCCVLHSAFDAYNDVFETCVISDLCGSTSGNDSHECALHVLRECITKERVVTADKYN